MKWVIILQQFLIAVVCATLPLLLGNAGRSQDVRWGPPSESQTVDFASKESPARVVFLDAGMAGEVPFTFALVGHKKVTLHTNVSEAGRFTVHITADGRLID